MFCILCGPWSMLRGSCSVPRNLLSENTQSRKMPVPCWMFRVTSSVVRFTKSVFRFTSSVVRVPCSVRPVFRVHGFSCPKIHCRNLIGLGLCVVNEFPTRFCHNSRPSLLDVTCVVDKANVVYFDQLSLPGVSDHDMLFLAYNINLHEKICDNFITFRDFKNINVEALIAEASVQPWDDCWFLADINEKVEFLSVLLNYLYEKYVPLRKIKKKSHDQPWFNDNIKNAIKERGRMYSRWKRSPTDKNWESFRSARNHAVNVTKAAKTRYFHDKLNVNMPQKQLWNNIRNLGVGKQSGDECPIDADSLNDYFLSSNKFNNSKPFQLNEKLIYRHSSRFQFKMATESDILKCLYAIKSNAAGEDLISIRFVKLILPQVIGVLTHIINFSLTTRIFPSKWKTANIIPVAKKRGAILQEDFRPISILPAFSKVFEKFLALQILEHLQKFKLLSQHQSGFRPKHSCATAINKIIDDIREKYDRGELSILVLLDFSKAFDTLDFEVLLRKLEHYFGFDKYSLQLMKSYLHDRSQRVCINGKASKLGNIQSGVPQGSILGPILFVMFINDIVYCCENVSIHLYADDAQLYLSRPIGLSEDLISRINDDLDRISSWAERNSLKLNAAKTQALPISHTDFDVTSLPDICVNNVPIKFENVVTSLGFKLNRRLDCRDHVNSTVSKMYAILRSLWASSCFLSSDLKLKLIKSLLVPILSYGGLVYGNLDSSSRQKLQLAVNNAARYVFLKQKYDHISVFSKQILNCDVKKFYEVINLVFMHKLIYTHIPQYLFNKLSFCQSTRSFNLILPIAKYLVTSRMFFVSTAKLWNNLPVDIKRIRNKKLFKLAVLGFSY